MHFFISYKDNCVLPIRVLNCTSFEFIHFCYKNAREIIKLKTSTVVSTDMETEDQKNYTNCSKLQKS